MESVAAVTYSDDVPYEFQVLILATMHQKFKSKLFETKPVLFDTSLTCSIANFDISVPMMDRLCYTARFTGE